MNTRRAAVRLALGLLAVGLLWGGPGGLLAQPPTIDTEPDGGIESADAGSEEVGDGAAGGAVDGAVEAGTAPTGPRARAQELLTYGNRLVARGSFEAALSAYRAAFELHPSPKLLVNIGTTLRHLGRHAEAAAAYEQYIRDPHADSARVAELRQLLTDVDSFVGRLTLQADATAEITFFVDGRQIAVRGGRAMKRVDPGRHTVRVESVGSPPFVETVRVAAGEHRTFRSSVADGAEGSDQRTAAYGVGVVGVVALGLGAVFGTLSLISVAEYEEDGTPELQEAANQHGVVAIAGLAGGTVALGTALALYFTAPQPEATTRVITGCGPAGWGLGVMGHW